VDWQDKQILLLSSIRELRSAQTRCNSLRARCPPAFPAVQCMQQRLDWNKNVSMVFLNTYLLFFYRHCVVWSTCFPMCWKWRMETRAIELPQCNWSVGSQNWERHTTITMGHWWEESWRNLDHHKSASSVFEMCLYMV